MLITTGLLGLVKLGGICAVTGLGVTIIQDLKEKGMLKLPMSVKTMRSIPLGNRHMAILGMTQNGKTYATVHSLAKSNKGVLFFNLQHEPMPKNFVDCDGSADVETVIQLLDSGEKINFLPSTDLQKASKSIVGIINSLYDGNKHDIYVAIDEVHLYDKQAQNAIMRIATAGLKWGLKGVFISQRGARMSNDLLGQSEVLVTFNLKMQDRKYLHDYGYPIDEMMSKINEQKYHFVIYEQNEVRGAYKIG